LVELSYSNQLLDIILVWGANLQGYWKRKCNLLRDALPEVALNQLKLTEEELKKSTITEVCVAMLELLVIITSTVDNPAAYY
jgi:hypothetical protein